MKRIRIIPTLLVSSGGLVKGKQFKNHRYVGDPMNALRIFNTKEVDELMMIDIGATREGRCIDAAFVERVASECFMPLTVGGGVASSDQAAGLFRAGADKVVLNSSFFDNPGLVGELAHRFGAQSVVFSLDVKRGFMGKYSVYSQCGQTRQRIGIDECLARVSQAGFGEILVNSIDNDGMRCGFDTRLIRTVSDAVNIPVVAVGGARGMEDFVSAVKEGGASACAAGNLFVFHGKREAVLISYPEGDELTRLARECAA